MLSSQYDEMINGNVKKTIIRLAIPTIISMLITSVYNVADTYFVSKINTSASAAVSIVFSLQTLIQAIGFTLGMGCGSLVSRLLGKKEKDKADEVISSTLLMGVIFGVIFMTLGLIFNKEICYMMGATETSVDYAAQYALFMFISTPLMIISFILNNTLRSEGHASLSMIGISAGGFLNMGLDPLFIFAFKMGVYGAGLSTMVSQIISTFILISVFLFHKAETSPSYKKISKDMKLYLTILRTGSPTLFRQGCSSLANILLNLLAHPYGDACIAALGISNKIYQFARSIVVGIGQGYQPFLGYNYGAKKNDRIKEGIIFTILTDTAVCLVFTLAVLLIPKETVAFFRDDEDVIAIGKYAVMYLAISFPFLGFSTVINQSLQVTGFSKSASFLASLRQGLLFIPLVYLLSYLFKDTGLCLTQPVSDLLTAVVSTPFLFFFFNILKKNVDSENIKDN